MNLYGAFRIASESERHCLSVEDPRGARHWGHLRATDLYKVGSFYPDHDAVVRIGGEAPGGGAHSFGRHQVPCSNTASRHLGSSIRQSC